MTYAKESDYYEDENYEETTEDFDEDMRRFRRWERAPLQSKFTEKPIRQPIDAADGMSEFIEKMARRSAPVEDKEKPNKEFSEEDRRAFFEERDRHLDEVWSRKTKEELIESSIETYSEIPMYDFGLGEKTNHQAIMDFYGYDLYKRICKEIDDSYECPSDGRETGQITRDLWQQLRDIRAGRKPRSKSKPIGKPSKSGREKSKKSISAKSNKTPKTNAKKAIQIHQRQRQPGDDYRLFTERGLIRNESYVELFKGPGVVYEMIWANLVRKGWHDTEEYPIRRMYHDDQKLLVYCTSWRHLARQCKMSVNTVIDIVRKFEDAGIVQTETYKPHGRKQEQTVFILGRWTGSGGSYQEHLYRNEKLLSPKVSKK